MHSLPPSGEIVKPKIVTPKLPHPMRASGGAIRAKSFSNLSKFNEKTFGLGEGPLARF